MYIDIKLNVDGKDAVVLTRIITPIAQAIADAIRPELESLRDQVVHANDLAEKVREDLACVNEARNDAKEELHTANTRINYLEDQIDKLLSENDEEHNKRIDMLSKLEAAQTSAAKWENEALELLATSDETIGKVKAELSEVKTLAMEQKEVITRLQRKLDNIVIALND